MGDARESLQEAFYDCVKGGGQRPVILCHYNGVTLKYLHGGREGQTHDMPAVLASAGGFPTLATLLHRHSQVSGSLLPSLEIDKHKESPDNYIGTVAVCGYQPTRADFAMAYRNQIRYVIQLSLNGESSCYRVTQSFPPDARAELIQRADAAGDRILDAEWVDGDLESSVTFADLVDHDWFDKFLTPVDPKTAPRYLGGEDLTEELRSQFGSLSSVGAWMPHKAGRNTVVWWMLVSLYTNFAWATQLPTYRAFNEWDRRKRGGISDAGSLLDGFNVSGLLLDPSLKPVAWSFNSNRINKSLHAETALVLAWMKGHRAEKEFTNYTFISPWRSCCMCSGWIADVFKNSKTIWFIDDPGLPIRHLDHGANGAIEVFLPRFLDQAVLTDPRFQTIIEAFPWFRVMGRATHWDYNNQYLQALDELRMKDAVTGALEGPIRGPTDLFWCRAYFEHLTAAWEMTRMLPKNVLELLQSAGELQAYVNNIWSLRRCVMAFDQS